MGSVLYNFLGDSFLLNQAAVEARYDRYSNAQIADELAKYREFVIANLSELNREASANESQIALIANESTTPIGLLTHGSLYLDRFIVSDPLFRLTRIPTSAEIAHKAFLGGRQSDAIDRSKVASAASYLKAITPFVASDYVRVLPFSMLSEPPEQLPLFYSKTGFRDLLAPTVLDFMRARAHVRPTKKAGNDWLVLDKELSPCRGIAVSFEGDTSDVSALYFLWATRFEKVAGKADVFSTTMTLPATPPDKQQFDAWVDQSINKTAHTLVQRVVNAASFAATFKAMYLAPTQLSAEIADLSLENPHTIGAFSATQALSLELPWLANASPALLMRIRSDDGESFARFRSAFDAKMREIRTVSDPEELRVKTENAVHDLMETQVSTLEAKMKSLRLKMAGEAGIAILGLTGAIQTGGWTLLASALAAAQGLRTWADYRANVRDNPSYFALRLKHAAK
jgi:hypothetical protein